jgi:TIR domain
MKNFISYSFKDKEKFENLCFALEGRNIPFWNTDEIAVGEQLRARLREAVTKCPVCVFLATKNSLKSGWCLAEVGAFWGAGKPVIVFLDDNDLSDNDLPKQLQGDKWTRGIKEVVGSLKFYMDQALQNENEQRSPLVEYNRDSIALYGLKAKALRTATTDVWMFGAVMHHTLSNFTSAIIERIKAGVEYNILICDPTGEKFEMSACSFGQKKGELEIESVTTLNACIRMEEVLKQEENVGGKLNVRLIDNLFPAGVYFFDPRSEMGRMLLVPHVPDQDAAEVPGFIFQPSPNGPLEHYFDMYQRIWKQATPLATWVNANKLYWAKKAL